MRPLNARQELDELIRAARLDRPSRLAFGDDLPASMAAPTLPLPPSGGAAKLLGGAGWSILGGAVAVSLVLLARLPGNEPATPTRQGSMSPQPQTSRVDEGQEVAAPAPASSALVLDELPVEPSPAGDSSGPRKSNSDRALLEAELIDAARRALRTDPALALELTRRHGHEFPHGLAHTEASVVRIEALFRLGRLSEARTRLEAFERAEPQSLHLPRLRRTFAKFSEQH